MISRLFPRSFGLLFAAFSLLPHAMADEKKPSEIAEPSDYRMENFRAKTPDTLKGARVLTTADAANLWKSGKAAFIDVLPRPPKPSNLPADTVYREKPRSDIPGSIWLPDTGYGALAAPMLAYFERGLSKASGGGKGKPLVFYCLRDCWMSWNAARRAISLGYGDVMWYPDGTDGWTAETLPLENREPEPRE